MQSIDYRNILDKIVHHDLYGSPIEEHNIEEVYRYLETSDSFFATLRSLIHLRTNETLSAYEKYIKKFFLLSPLEIKLEVLHLQEQYQDFIKESATFLAIFCSLSFEEKIRYLENKKEYTSLDIECITLFLNEKPLSSKQILSTLLQNDKIQKKIPSFSLSLTNFSLPISIEDFPLCHLLTKESFTQLLLRKCKSFSSFLSLYKKNARVYDLLMENGLCFSTKANEEIHSFILENHNFIGKFHKQYLKLFSIVEIKEISKDSHLDGNAYSTIMQALFQYNEENASIYFSEESLRKCAKHSLSVIPFSFLSESLRTTIFSDYSLFNRFIDTVMVEGILSYFDEEEIVPFLRNDSFIEDISSYAIQFLLNKLSFKTSFNMLQRKNILDKVENLNTSIEKKDAIFIPGFLDSPSLVYKANHRMLYHMILLLNKEDTLYYLALPYIHLSLTKEEIIEILLEKDISLSFVLSKSSLKSQFSTNDYIFYLDKAISPHFDFSIFLNKEFSCMLFPLDKDTQEKIDFKEVNYLFETILMKSFLSHQDGKISFASYKAVLISYLILGLDGTLALVSNGNKEINFSDVKRKKKEILEEKILLFKENNSTLFQDLPKKLFEQLHKFSTPISKKDFIKEIHTNTFVANLIHLLEENAYDTSSHIIDRFYNYVLYYKENLYLASKELYDYMQAFVSSFLEKKVDEYQKEFERIFLNNFKPKEKMLYDKKKEIGRVYLQKLKLKLFVQALTAPHKEEYKIYFRENYPLDQVKMKYLRYLNSDKVDFTNLMEHVLIPLVNERFDKYNCLRQLGIKKPDAYDAYVFLEQDFQTLMKINSVIATYQEKYKPEEFLSILNFICYGSPIMFTLSRSDKKIFTKLREQFLTIKEEVYIDKTAFKFLYSSLEHIAVTEEILEYKRYLELLDEIILKTKRYVNRYMLTDNIKQIYEKEYIKRVHSTPYTFPITEKNYSLKKRVFSLLDIEKVFSGYDLSQYKHSTPSLKRFLFQDKNILMVAEGYYYGIVDHLGLIMSNWGKIREKAKDLHITSISLLQANHLLTLLHSEEEKFSNLLEQDILYPIMESGYYEVNDLVIRLRMLSSLYQDSFSSISSSIPYLSYQQELYTIKVLDPYEKDTFIGFSPTNYKVGAIGNDFFCYSILHKNGCQIGIYEKNTFIGKLLGVRNGNTLFLHLLEGHFTSSMVSLLKEFGNQFIQYTMHDAEPIEFVTIVNNENYSDPLGLILDTTVCERITSPILELKEEEFKNHSYLLHRNEEIFTNYDYQISTLLASSLPVCKNNFKFYDPKDQYKRRRGKVLKLSSTISEENSNRINRILYMMQKKGFLKDIPSLDLYNMDTIYLGDDYVLFVTNTKEILSFVLPYDERALQEVENLVQKRKEEKISA